MYEVLTEQLPIKIWARDLETEALQQLKNLANLGTSSNHLLLRHVAAMPDCHFGYGMPVGGVIAALDIVIPYAVGVDIGCGMCAVKTPWTVQEIDIDTLKKIMGEIRRAVPVGFDHHGSRQEESLMPSKSKVESLKKSIVLEEYASACKQLGTLGGGNHFIEVQKDTTTNEVWLMIHSGSRNLGLKIANYYNKMAESKNAQWGVPFPKKYQLAYLPIEDSSGQDYLVEMQYALDFAFANRKLMMDRIAEIFNNVVAWKKIDMSQLINIHHNYAVMEEHFGQTVWVHRKGATSARKDQLGIIPGSQGTKSYIVKGKGNPDSFMSCSHGAGRKLSRSKAKQDLNLLMEIAKLDSQGIIHGIRHKGDLDEAAGAYKDIDVVMQNQLDLVDVVTELAPMGVIKG